MKTSFHSYWKLPSKSRILGEGGKKVTKRCCIFLLLFLFPIEISRRIYFQENGFSFQWRDHTKKIWQLWHELKKPQLLTVTWLKYLRHYNMMTVMSSQSLRWSISLQPILSISLKLKIVVWSLWCMFLKGLNLTWE